MISPTIPGSCGSCGVHDCEFNAEETLCRVPLTDEAWLLDEVWPEFDGYLGQRKVPKAHVFVPWRQPRRFGLAYDWHCAKAKLVIAEPLVTLRRSLAMRGSRLHGGRRQKIAERFDRHYADAFGRNIPFNVNKLVIWQNFLPFLALDKTLGGREYDILLWRTPRHVLQATLDRAALHYPESATLNDFRSDLTLAEAEQVAIERAHRIVTPHRQLANLYPEKTTLIEWRWPDMHAQSQMPPRQIAFLGPTVARRGAYVVRDAMRKLALPFVVIGRNIEHPAFWNGLDVEERPLDLGCLDDIGLLVSPALTDFKPRLLMQALQRKIPVIATKACGLPPTDGLHFIEAFDSSELTAKIGALRPTKSD